MPATLKQFVRVGMRNPYFIDVKMEQDLFQEASKGTESTTISALIDYQGNAAQPDNTINAISELPRGLKNYYHLVQSQRDKLGALLNFIGSMKAKRMIIFFGTCASVNFHAQCLKLLFNEDDSEHTIAKLHGKINQKKRTKIYKEFRELKLGETGSALLLTTDLAARGIDIPDVDWIVQFDPPQWSD